MPTKLLHFLPSLDPKYGGPIRAVLDLSMAFVRRGKHVTLATTELPNAAELRAQYPGVVFEVLQPALVRGHMLRRPALAQAELLLQKADMLHVHGTWDYSNVQMSRIARRLGKPYYVSVRGMLDDWCMEQKALKKRLFLFAMGKAHLESARAVHLTADEEFEQSRKWFPRGSGWVIPNLLDLQPFRTLPGPQLAVQAFKGLQTNEPVVLFLSRMHIKKGAEVLLQAASILQAKGDFAQFVFAGGGDEGYVARLKQQARQLGIENRVHFVGHVEGELKISLYQAAHCLALPTHQENFGFVFPEAMATGTPVITTKGVDIWPQLERGGAVIVDRTPQAFADALHTLLHSPEQRAALASKAREFVFEEYDEIKIVKQFEAMYRLNRGDGEARDKSRSSVANTIINSLTLSAMAFPTLPTAPPAFIR